MLLWYLHWIQGGSRENVERALQPVAGKFMASILQNTVNSKTREPAFLCVLPYWARLILPFCSPFFIGEQVTHFAAVMQSADRSENKAERINWIDFTLTYAEVLLQNAVISRHFNGRRCRRNWESQFPRIFGNRKGSLYQRDPKQRTFELFSRPPPVITQTNCASKEAKISFRMTHSLVYTVHCTGDDFEQFRSISVTVKRPRILS